MYVRCELGSRRIDHDVAQAGECINTAAVIGIELNSVSTRLFEFVVKERCILLGDRCIVFNNEAIPCTNQRILGSIDE